MKYLLSIIILFALISCKKETDCLKCTTTTTDEGYEPFSIEDVWCHKSAGYIDSLIKRNTYDVEVTRPDSSKYISHTVTTCEPEY